MDSVKKTAGKTSTCNMTTTNILEYQNDKS